MNEAKMFETALGNNQAEKEEKKESLWKPSENEIVLAEDSGQTYKWKVKFTDLTGVYMERPNEDEKTRDEMPLVGKRIDFSDSEFPIFAELNNQKKENE